MEPHPHFALGTERGVSKNNRKCAAMEIIQEEKNGIVCVTVRGCMEAGLAPAFEKTIQEIIVDDRRRLFLI